MPAPGVWSVQFSTNEQDYFFDFLHDADKLSETYFKYLQNELFADPDKYWFIQNAKFDLHQLKNYDCDFAGEVHCTKALARVMNNTEETLSLDDLGAKYLGENKIKIEPPKSKVKKWGRNENFVELKHFDKLPLSESLPYGLKDVNLCRRLGQLQIAKINEQSRELQERGINSNFNKFPSDIMAAERKLTKTCFQMERRGILIDREYTEKAYHFECDAYTEIKSMLDAIATDAVGSTVDWLSPKQLKPLFDALGEPYSYTEKGNASFDKSALEQSQSDLAKMILKYRYHYKRAHTYFENFIWYADTDNVLHADIQQGGTDSGRMSYWEPNLQNVPKRADKDETSFKVRGCFVPRPGYIFADFDWDQMEYRLLINYSKEQALIEKISAGLDVHDATKDEMQIENREDAKTINFQTLYGGGEAKLALALFECKLTEQSLKDIWSLYQWEKWSKDKIKSYIGKPGFHMGRGKWAKEYRLNFSEDDFEHDFAQLLAASELKKLYFKKLPATSDWIVRVKEVAKSRGFVVNWAGRKLNFTRDTAYKSPNHLIQGGCGDVSKTAMILTEAHLQGKDAHLLLQVHDELLTEIRPDELHLINEIKNIMENVISSMPLKLTAGAAVSEKSWADLHDA